MKRALLLITSVVCTVNLSISQSYTEGADLPNSPGGPIFTVAAPSIIIAGGLSTPGDGQDNYQIEVPAGCTITGVDFTMTDNNSLGVTGFAQFGVGNQVTTPPLIGSFTMGPSGPFPVGPGTYACSMVANIAFNDNWTMVFHTSCTACNEPDVPTVTADTAICSGESIDLDVLSGNLNDATAWEWYSASCGGTSEGSGTTLSVSPTVTTTYYARGEGGCTTPANCDSVVVTVNTVDNGITQNGDSLSADATGASYVWLDCDNSMSVIAGATSQDYQATSNGNYAVEVTQNGCVDTSACLAVTGIGFEEHLNSFVNFYPNPAENQLFVEMNLIGESVLELTDIQGRIILVAINSISDQLSVIDVSGLESGTYFVRISNSNYQKVIPIVKE